MTVSADPYANSMVEALSLSFRDQMSILLVLNESDPRSDVHYLGSSENKA